MSFNLLFLLALVALGLTVSYEDWRERKIRNRWLLLGMGAGLAGYGYLLLNTVMGTLGLKAFFLGEYYLPSSFYPLAAVHVALVAAAGLGMWYLRIWPAGDAKLYIIFAVLAPLVDHNLRGFPYLLFLKMLVDIFIPAACWVLLVVLAGLAWKVRRLGASDLRREAVGLLERLVIRTMDLWPQRRMLGLFALNFLAMFALMDMLSRRVAVFDFMRTGMGRLLLLGFLLVAWSRVRLAIQKVPAPLVWGGLALLYWFDPDVHRLGLLVVLARVLRTTLVFGVALMAFNVLVSMHLRAENRREVAVTDLSPGMVLAEDSWRTLAEMGAGRRSELPGRFADGLFSDDVATIRSWGDLPQMALAVYQTMPFGMWVFMGTLLAITLKENVMFYLIGVFR
ncbi:MAG: hypothetical protein HY927_11145 [Elusimicrobia bacterium]|nr:hypothetical protein [Elusimicrobiota bacterium]